MTHTKLARSELLIALVDDPIGNAGKRDVHPKYGHLDVVLPWFYDSIVLEHFRNVARGLPQLFGQSKWRITKP